MAWVEAGKALTDQQRIHAQTLSSSQRSMQHRSAKNHPKKNQKEGGQDGKGGSKTVTVASTGGWGKSGQTRASQAGLDSLHDDNEVGWGADGYVSGLLCFALFVSAPKLQLMGDLRNGANNKNQRPNERTQVPYKPEAPKLGPETDGARVRGVREELPSGRGAAAATEVVGDRIGDALTRLSLSPAQLFSLSLRHQDMRLEAEAAEAHRLRRERLERGERPGGGDVGGSGNKRKGTYFKPPPPTLPIASTTTSSMNLVKQAAAVDVGRALEQLTKLRITAKALDEVMAVLTSSSSGVRQRDDGAEPGCVTLSMIKRNLPKLVGEGKKAKARAPSEISPKKKKKRAPEVDV